MVLAEVKFLIIFANSIFSAPVQEPCPICMEMFTADLIEVHAASCGERYIIYCNSVFICMYLFHSPSDINHVAVSLI